MDVMLQGESSSSPSALFAAVKDVCVHWRRQCTTCCC